MAPLSAIVEAAVTTRNAVPNAGRTVANDFSLQWRNPSDIFSLLLLVGGDVIQKALAQFSMNRFRPVAFSFGWVAYAFSALLFAVGNLKVLPDPDCPCTLIATRSELTLANQSWLLGRLLRNHEHWSRPLVRTAMSEGRIKEQDLHDAIESASRPVAPLRIYVYDAVPLVGHRWTPAVKDWPWFSGLACTLLQLVVASIPAALYREWEILMVTAAGTALAYATAHASSLGAVARRNTGKTFALTEGIGSRNAIVIRGKGAGIDLMQMASVSAVPTGQLWRTVAASVQLILWIGLLITVSGLHTHTWYMVCVGSMGMLQNIVLAGAPRTTASLGMPLELAFVVTKPKAMDTLASLEEEEPFAGKALLPVFFPGGLRGDEQSVWDALEAKSEDAYRQAQRARRREVG